MRHMTRWLILTSLLGFAVDSVGADSPAFTLDILAPTSQEVSLTVPASGLVPIGIMRSGASVAAESVDLNLSEFTSAQGTSIAVLLIVDGAALPARAMQAKVPFHGFLLPVHLQVPRFPTAGRYSGTLALAVPGQGLGTVWRIDLSSAQESRPATLVLDQGPVTVSATRPLCLWRGQSLCLGRGEEPVVTVHVRDKTGQWPLEGVTAHLEPGLKTAGHSFDTERDLRATFNGSVVKDLFASPGDESRSVAPGQQATVRMEFMHLSPGEYTIPIRFAAVNSAVDDLQCLTVTIQVRDGLFPAFLVILAASLLSFVATRVVSTLRLRAAFLGKVRAMRPAWLTQEPPVLAVIWLRAMVRQAEDLSRRFWLTGQAELETKLTQAAGMLALLGRVHQVRARLQQHLDEAPIRRRAMWALDAILGEIGSGPLSDDQLVQAKAALDELEAWVDPAKREAHYWADLLPAIQRHLSIVHVTAVPENGRDVVAGLVDQLRQAVSQQQPGGQAPSQLPLDRKMLLEETYERLRILWELRNAPDDFRNVVGLHRTYPLAPVEEVFRVVDEASWKRLFDQATGKKVVVEGPPADSLDRVEAFSPVTFRIATPGDPSLEDTYLIRQKLTYLWTIELKSVQHPWLSKGSRKSKTRSLGVLRVASVVPQVAQYAPQAGEIVVTDVKIHYGSLKALSVAPNVTVPVRKSKDFQIWQIAEGADILALGVAVIVGLVSGLAIYAQAPIFGALKDYLSLFTWGAGVDQGKNFIQALGSQGAARQ